MNRVQLAAALLDYDEPELENGPHDPSSKAQQSALLTPFRHLLGSPSAITQNSPANYEGISTQDTRREGDPDDGYFGSSQYAVAPGAYSASSSGGSALGAISPRPLSRLSINDRLDVGTTSNDADEVIDDEAQERLNQEWGLGDYLSQLGSGPIQSPISPNEGSQFSFPTSPQVASWLMVDAEETRSMPDLERLRVDSSADTPGSGAMAGDDISPATSTRKIRILERKPGVSAVRPRTQSLGVTTSSLGLSLPTFSQLPTFEELQRNGTRPASTDPLISPRLSGDTRLTTFSLAKHSEAVAHPRPLSSLARASSSSDRLTRHITPNLASPAATSTLALPAVESETRDMDNDSRPLSSLSMVTMPDRPGSTGFTSRFDPAVIAAQRAEMEKERPRFANKEAGAPPRVVLMPTPLAGRPLSPPPLHRGEGPEGTNPNAKADEEELEPKIERPAGALYGRSLMDVMEEKKRAQKAQQRSFVPGQDGRRAMMEWQDTIAGKDLIVKQGQQHDGEGGGATSGMPAASRPRALLSVFGRDLHYERDLELLREVEEQEAQERKEEDRKESEVWEKVRVADEEKRQSKSNKLIRGDKKRRALLAASTEPVVAPLSAEMSTSKEPSNIYASFDTSHHTRAPSLTLPRLETEPLGSSEDWYPPALRPASPASSSSSRSDQDKSQRRPTFELTRPFYTRDASSQLLELRNAVMQGTMSAEQAAAAAQHLGLGSGSSNSGGAAATGERDHRPMGERLSSQFFEPGQKQPPRWQLDFGTADADDDDDDATDEGAQRMQLSGVRLVDTPDAVSEDSDDRPLALIVNQDEDEDVPLAIKAAANLHLGGGEDGEDDDVPLGLTPASQMRDQYLQQVAMQEQQRQMHAAHAQSQMYIHAQAQQSAAYFAMQQHLAVNGSGQMVPGFGGESTTVERWRQGVSSDGR